jgi:ketosteroid isomerase-like protein
LLHFPRTAIPTSSFQEDAVLHIGLAVFAALAATGFIPSSAEQAAIRKLGQQFTEARRSGDRAGMERVLHPDYVGHQLPAQDGLCKTDLGRAEAVDMWTDLARVFRDPWFKPSSVRVLGTTAIETGTMGVVVGRASARERHLFSGVDYVRVWMRGKDGWRVVHESY